MTAETVGASTRGAHPRRDYRPIANQCKQHNQYRKAMDMDKQLANEIGGVVNDLADSLAKAFGTDFDRPPTPPARVGVADETDEPAETKARMSSAGRWIVEQRRRTAKAWQRAREEARQYGADRDQKWITEHHSPEGHERDYPMSCPLCRPKRTEIARTNRLARYKEHKQR